MGSYASKLILVGIAIIALYFGSINAYQATSDITNRTVMLNDTVNFINRICDTGVCTDDMLQDYNLSMSSFGVPVDVKITRYETIVNPNSTTDVTAGTHVSLTPNSNTDIYNQGDTVQVEVHFLGRTPIQKLLWKVMRVFSMNVDFALSGVVRH